MRESESNIETKIKWKIVKERHRGTDKENEKQRRERDNLIKQKGKVTEKEVVKEKQTER